MYRGHSKTGGRRRSARSAAASAAQQRCQRGDLGSCPSRPSRARTSSPSAARLAPWLHTCRPHWNTQSSVRGPRAAAPRGPPPHRLAGESAGGPVGVASRQAEPQLGTSSGGAAGTLDTCSTTTMQGEQPSQARRTRPAARRLGKGGQLGAHDAAQQQRLAVRGRQLVLSVQQGTKVVAHPQLAGQQVPAQAHGGGRQARALTLAAAEADWQHAQPTQQQGAPTAGSRQPCACAYCLLRARPSPPAAAERLALESNAASGIIQPRGVPPPPGGRSGGSMSSARCMLSQPTENTRWQAATKCTNWRSVPVQVRACSTWRWRVGGAGRRRRLRAILAARRRRRPACAAGDPMLLLPCTPPLPLPQQAGTCGPAAHHDVVGAQAEPLVHVGAQRGHQVEREQPQPARLLPQLQRQLKGGLVKQRVCWQRVGEGGSKQGSGTKAAGLWAWPSPSPAAGACSIRLPGPSAARPTRHSQASMLRQAGDRLQNSTPPLSLRMSLMCADTPCKYAL